MKQKALLFTLLSLVALSQTTHSMSILNALESAHTTWSNKSTTDKVKLGLLVTSGLIAAKFVYNWTMDLRDLIENHKRKLAAKVNKMNTMLATTDLFFIEDIKTRHAKVKKYFTENPEMINEPCVWPHSPKAPTGKPLKLALQIKDYSLALWFMKQGATAEGDWTIEKLEQEISNIQSFENFMDEYCLPYSGRRPAPAPEYGTVELP